MAKKNRKGKRRNALANQVYVNAPKQKLIATDTQSLMSLFPVFRPAGYNNQNLTMTARSNANGYSVELFDGSGTPISTYSALFGEQTNQFPRFSNLFEEYRLDEVKMRIMPAACQICATMSPSFSAIDSIGEAISSYDPTYFARAPNAQDHTPYVPVSRSLDYRGWLTQNTVHPYLKTNDGSGTRELYGAIDGIQRVPGLAYLSNFTLLSTSAQFVLFYVKFEAKYTFRGLRQDEVIVKPQFEKNVLKPELATQDGKEQPQHNVPVKPNDLSIVGYADWLTKQKALTRFGVEANPGPEDLVMQDDDLPA